MFDNILQYLCVSRSKTIDEKEETFLTNVGNQQVCPYCGQHFSFSIMFNLHVDSCGIAYHLFFPITFQAKSGSMLPDPSQKQFNRSSSNPSFKTKASMTPSKALTILKKEQLEQIENIVNNLLIQSSQKRQKQELHFLTKYAKNASPLTFFISNDWLKELLNYLKGGQSYPPGPITNTEISYRVKQAQSQGSLELKALGTNTIVWYFLFRMYGGGPEVYMEGEPSAHFRTSIEAISSKSNNMGRTTQTTSKTGHNYEESKLSGYSTDSSLAASLQYSGNLTGLGITIKGFRNEGFYCYMNSSIQLLFAINELASSLKYGQYRDSIRVADPKYWKAMAETVALIESNGSSIVIPQSLRKLAVTRFRSSEQHDAHEFLLYLLSGMQDEINLPRPKGAVSLNDPETAWAYYRKYNISLVDQLFAGQLLSILTCGRCKNISKTYEAFLVLTLPMVQHKRRSINECLEMFTMKEEIRSGYECEYCRTRGSAYKQLELSKLPRLLIVHLSRIQMRPRKTKISGYVEFPIRTWRIKMGDYKEEKEYSLLGMVCHTGGVDSGHYTAFIRKDKEWYLCDDSKIKKVSEDNVAGHEAYILLYEQKS